VTDDVSKLGYTSVIFLDLRVKVDKTYYCDMFLSQQLLPAIRHVSRDLYFRQESHAVARELRDVAAVVFGSKFADNIHYKFE